MDRSAVLLRLGGLGLALARLGAAKPSLPTAAPDIAVTPTDLAVHIVVLANDYELGGGLRLLKAFKPGHGSVRIEGDDVVYTPEPGFAGSDQFQYLVQPQGAQPRVGTVTVEVGGGGVMLRLSGQVVDNPIPGAVVTVSVGGNDIGFSGTVQDCLLGDDGASARALSGFDRLVEANRAPAPKPATRPAAARPGRRPAGRAARSRKGGGSAWASSRAAAWAARG